MLGAIVSAAALRWAGQHGARRTYLQVSADNTPAVALYERMGFSRVPRLVMTRRL